MRIVGRGNSYANGPGLPRITARQLAEIRAAETNRFTLAEGQTPA